MPTKCVVGIDYSMSCPAITITDTINPFSFNTCVLYYLSAKTANNVLPNVFSSRLIDFNTNEERFDYLSEWAVRSICDRVRNDATIYIEDYSFGSKGKTFHIAENAGLVKHKLWKLGFDIVPVPPTVIKKYATGKGTATKDQMYAAFMKETGVELMKLYQPKAATVGSPVGDLVDSYYICKYGQQQAKYNR
jgi:Holliday junction resolvasome RuvABC endonuclease subunit